MLCPKSWAVLVAACHLLLHTSQAKYISEEDTSVEDGSHVDLLREDRMFEYGGASEAAAEASSRGGRSLSSEGRSYRQDATGRNFVGLSWFAPAAPVRPVECTATNGALDVGTCFSDALCNDNGGVASGVCASGGVCCIFPTVCGGTVMRNRTWFVNKDFPDYTRDPNDCRLTIKQADTRIKQVRLDFVVSELGDAVQGRCTRDYLTVRRESGNVDLIPPLCGDNTGQHVYVDFAHQQLKLVIKTETNLRRKWHILITQIMPGQEVPSGCLQYYTDRTATVKSLNYNSGSYLFKGDMDYDICFPPGARSGTASGSECERRTADIDLRQSENDVRTRKGRINGRVRKGRSLPIVMTFNEERKKDKYSSTSYKPEPRRNSERTRSRSMPTMYSLVSDPVYSQIDNVMSQLQSPANTGLESLLNSRSKLSQMKDQFSEKESGPEDAYYYYYYEDDNSDFVNNDLDESPGAPVTDNYAVEHVHREFMVLPDGSPVPGNYYVRAPANLQQNQESYTTEIGDENKYFHTGMLEDIKEEAQEDSEDPQYPTPTYYQRKTTSPVNLLKPEHPVASIMMFDPHSFVTDGSLVYADPYGQQQQTDVPGDPSNSQFTINDFSTLSTINPEDEYTLKHDGVQWLFLKNDDESTKQSTALPSTTPEEIVNEEEELAVNKPHLVFKHPSGTETEFYISPGDDNLPREKIVTVIETGPITQNYTKFKISDISELDKIIENVFNIVSESSEKTDLKDSVLDGITEKTPTAPTPYPKTTYPSTFPDATTDSQTHETTYLELSGDNDANTEDSIIVVTQSNEDSLVKDDLKFSEGYMSPEVSVEEKRVTTLYNRRFTKSDILRNTNSPEPTTLTADTNSPETTRLTTQSITHEPTRFTTHSITPEPTRFTTHSITPEPTRFSTHSMTPEPTRHTTYSNSPEPTRIITRFTNIPVTTQNTGLPEMTRLTTRPQLIRYTTRPHAVRITTLPENTRFVQSSEHPVRPELVRLTTTHPTTTPAASQPTFTIPHSPSRLITRFKSSQRPSITGLTRVPVTQITSELPTQTSFRPYTIPFSAQSIKPSISTKLPQRIYTTKRIASARPSITTMQDISFTEVQTETEPPVTTAKTVIPSTLAQASQTSDDPFSTMLNNLESQTSTAKPLFTISTTTNGVQTTKTYTTVEEALADLTKITKPTISNSQTPASNPDPISLSTVPYNLEDELPTTAAPASPEPVSIQDLIADADVDKVTIHNSEPCENSYIKVNNVKVCDQLLRSEAVRKEALRLFTDMERISVRSLGSGSLPMRFSLTYETVCPAAARSPAAEGGLRITTGFTRSPNLSTRAPQVKTVNLLQYLLGWYR